FVLRCSTVLIVLAFPTRRSSDLFVLRDHFWGTDFLVGIAGGALGACRSVPVERFGTHAAGGGEYALIERRRGVGNDPSAGRWSLADDRRGLLSIPSGDCRAPHHAAGVRDRLWHPLRGTVIDLAAVSAVTGGTADGRSRIDARSADLPHLITIRVRNRTCFRLA